ncbi:unnamed protein product, partial [marine sediment metagenome]
CRIRPFPSKNLALTTYHPDEALSYNTLERMKKGDFRPGREIGWGHLHFYILGITLKSAQLFGIVNPVSREFLAANLNEADKLYIVGRLLSIIFAVLSVYLIYLIVKKVYRVDYIVSELVVSSNNFWQYR